MPTNRAISGGSGGVRGRTVGAKTARAGEEYTLGAEASRTPMESWRYQYDHKPESAVWYPVPGHPGVEMGDCLEVRRADGGGRYRYSMPSRNTQGYLTVRVGDRRIGLHQLVALMAYGPAGPGEVVRHLDGDPDNNHPSNLAYGTARDNVRDAFRHGRRAQNTPRTTR
jgi:hypothetical protein